MKTSPAMHRREQKLKDQVNEGGKAILAKVKLVAAGVERKFITAFDLTPSGWCATFEPQPASIPPVCGGRSSYRHAVEHG